MRNRGCNSSQQQPHTHNCTCLRETARGIGPSDAVADASTRRWPAPDMTGDRQQIVLAEARSRRQMICAWHGASTPFLEKVHLRHRCGRADRRYQDQKSRTRPPWKRRGCSHSQPKHLLRTLTPAGASARRGSTADSEGRQRFSYSIATFPASPLEGPQLKTSPPLCHKLCCGNVLPQWKESHGPFHGRWRLPPRQAGAGERHADPGEMNHTHGRSGRRHKARQFHFFRAGAFDRTGSTRELNHSARARWRSSVSPPTVLRALHAR